VRDTHDHGGFVVFHLEQNDVAAMNRLAEAGGKVVAPLEGARVFGDAGKDLDEFIHKGHGAKRIVDRDEVADRRQIFERPRS